MNKFPESEERELPAPPNWKKIIGVGVVVMGMAVGTGELIMWPHLVAKHGLTILWLALVGITFQYFINQEVARYSLATGESFFTASAKIIKWSPIFWLFSAILLYVWPGWASALGTILKELFGFGNYIVWSLLSLLLVLIITFKGKIAYVVLETTLKIIVPIFIVLLAAVSFLNLDGVVVLETLKGVVNFGYIPKNIDVAVLLGAIVFAGAGGMLNLCVSLWYRDKQLGMSGYVDRISNPITGKVQVSSVRSFKFPLTEENLSKWRGWMKYIRIDQGIIFWLLGIISIMLLSANAFSVLVPQGLVPEGTNVAIMQAEIFRLQWGIVGEKLYLIMAYLMLFSVMWTVLDALTRIVSDIIHTSARVGNFKKLFSKFENISTESSSNSFWYFKIAFLSSCFFLGINSFCWVKFSLIFFPK